LDEAITAYGEALKIRPHYVEAQNNLANVLREQGCIEEAIAQIRQALRHQPAQPLIRSNLIYSLHFDPSQGDHSIAEELHRWNRELAAPLRPFRSPHGNDRDPERRLRIGYVSPDFYTQAESFFVVPLLEAHDHRQFEIHAYASVARPD